VDPPERAHEVERRRNAQRRTTAAERQVIEAGAARRSRGVGLRESDLELHERGQPSSAEDAAADAEVQAEKAGVDAALLDHVERAGDGEDEAVTETVAEPGRDTEHLLARNVIVPGLGRVVRREFEVPTAVGERIGGRRGAALRRDTADAEQRKHDHRGADVRYGNRVRHRSVRLIASVIAPAVLSVCQVQAQDAIALTADILFYGDNTEFRNPFREGATIFGTAGQLAAAVDVNPRVQVRLGAFGNVRFGSDDAFESVRPVVTLVVRGARSTFAFGTFPPLTGRSTLGPDRVSRHGLLPALQRESLAFERAYEAGLRWTFDGARLRHDAWINWQRLNTPRHRERFDTGITADWRLNRWLTLPAQLHVVHEGGQLHAAGPVRDSVAAGAGLRIAASPDAIGDVSVEVLALASRHVPDREQPARTRPGAGLFARAAVERGGWRAHAIVWRGDDFIKDEGDPNYGSLRRDGRLYRGVRDYAEAGLTRRLPLAPDVVLEASARLHRTERHYEYSYRLNAIASVRTRLR